MVTRLDDNQLTRSTDSSKHEERNKPEVKPDPEPSSSDSSLKTSSLDSRAKKKKRKEKKNVVSIGSMTRQTHLRDTTLILLMTVTDTSDAKIINTGKIIQSKYAQL